MLNDDDDIIPSATRNRTGVAAPSNAASSKLSSLFAAEEQWLGHQNQSLGYTGKKPKANNINNATPTSATNANTAAATAPVANPTNDPGSHVLHACPVNLIGYTPQSQPQIVGTRGFAMLKVVNTTGQAQLFFTCYEPQTQKQDLLVAISVGFDFIYSPPSYLSFYDERRQYWCIQTAPDQVDLILKHLVLMKNALLQTQHADKPNSIGLIYIDLATLAPNNSERTVATGDEIKIKYTMNLTSSSHPKGVGTLIGSVGSDAEPRGMKVGGKKELQGVEQGVIGMKKGVKRFLCIPPHLAYGQNGAGPVPGNATVLIELEILAIEAAAAGLSSPSSTATATALAANTRLAENATAATVTTASQSPESAIPAESVASPTAENRRESLTKRVAAIGGFRMPGLPNKAEETSETSSSASRVSISNTSTVTAPPNEAPTQPTQSQSQLAVGNVTLPAATQATAQAQPATAPAAQPQAQQQPSIQIQTPLQPSPYSQQAYNPYIASPHLHSPYAASPYSPVSPSLSLLESKVESLTSALSKLLGPNINSIVYDSPLSVAAIIRAWTAVQSEKDEATTKRDALDKKNEELFNKITALQEKLESQRGDYERKEERRYDQHQEELRNKNLSIAELRETKKSLDNEIAQLKLTIASNSSNNPAKELQAQLETLNKTAAEKEIFYNNSKAELSQQSERLSEKLAQQGEEKETLQKEIKELRSKLASQSGQDSAQQLHNLNVELATAQTAIEEARREISQWKGLAEEREDSVKVLQNQLAEAKTALEVAQQNSSASTTNGAELQLLRADLDKSKQENVSQKHELSQLQDELERAAAEKQAEYSLIKERTEAMKQAAKERISALEEEVSDLEAEKQQIIQLSKQKIEELKRKFRETLEAQNNQHNGNEEEYTNKSTEINENETL
jgi:predicted  nucleic acid-binding Zn-ribbon protein